MCPVCNIESTDVNELNVEEDQANSEQRIPQLKSYELAPRSVSRHLVLE